MSDLPKKLKITYFFQVLHHLEGFSDVLCFKLQKLIGTMHIEKVTNNGVKAFSLLGGKKQVKCLKHRLL